MINIASFWKPKACGQTELLDRSWGQIKKYKNWRKINSSLLKWDISGYLQTLCLGKSKKSWENEEDKMAQTPQSGE